MVNSLCRYGIAYICISKLGHHWFRSYIRFVACFWCHHQFVSVLDLMAILIKIQNILHENVFRNSVHERLTILFPHSIQGLWIITLGDVACLTHLPLDKMAAISDICRYFFVNERFCILIKISLKFVLKGPVGHNPALVQIMAWRRIGVKTLSEPMWPNSDYAALGGYEFKQIENTGQTWTHNRGTHFYPYG